MEGMEIIGARGRLRGGGGPITLGGGGGGPIVAELIGGGPRVSGGKVEPSGGGIGVELTEQIDAELSDAGPSGAAGLGKGGSLEW